MSIVRSFVCFVTLTDVDELSRCSKYDFMVIYASFARQVFGAVFCFLIFLYSLLNLFDVFIAAIVSVVLGVIVFLIDQSIVGSEWTATRKYAKNPLINGGVVLAVKLLQLLPRILYAIVIALVMATLAELAIQSEKIDRFLKIQTREVNAPFIEKTESLDLRQREEASLLDSKIHQVGLAIKSKSDLIALDQVGLFEQRRSNAHEKRATFAGREQQLISETESLKGDIALLSSKVTKIKGEVDLLEIEKHAEEFSPERGARRGPRWRNLNEKQIKLKRELSSLEPLLLSMEQRRDSLQEQLSNSTIMRTKMEEELNIVLGSLAALNSDNVSVEELKSNYKTLKESKEKLVEEQSLEKESLRNELKEAGFYESAKYGPLDRYIGLKKLHNDKEYGSEARDFSNGLKVVIVLFELSPVLVAVLFAPFSFYASRMRVKVKRAVYGEEVSFKSSQWDEELAIANSDNVKLKELKEVEEENSKLKIDVAVLQRAAKDAEKIYKD